MRELSMDNHKKMSIKEYENFILSVEPLPIDLAKDLEKKHSRFVIKFLAMFVILFHILIIGLFKYFGNVPLGQRDLLLCMGTLLIISVLWIMYYRHHSKYTATLLPYGIEIGDISSEKMFADNYLAINAIDNMVLLEKLSQFIKFRKDGLLNMDFYALRIDDYFEIINQGGQKEYMTAKEIDTYINTNFERQAFEKCYIQNGGDLSLLVWYQRDDGTGTYVPHWTLIANDDPVYRKKVSQHAEHVTGCLNSWLACAKIKTIPDGYILMPKEPTQELIDNEMVGKVLPAVVGSHEQAVENFKIRYRKMIAAQSKINLLSTD